MAAKKGKKKTTTRKPAADKVQEAPEIEVSETPTDAAGEMPEVKPLGPAWLAAVLVVVGLGLGFAIYLAHLHVVANYGTGTADAICDVNSGLNCTTVAKSSWLCLPKTPVVREYPDHPPVPCLFNPPSAVQASSRHLQTTIHHDVPPAERHSSTTATTGAHAHPSTMSAEWRRIGQVTQRGDSRGSGRQTGVVIPHAGGRSRIAVTLTRQGRVPGYHRCPGGPVHR